MTNEEKPESEYALEWWAEELMKRGYIDNIKHHPQTFLITPKQEFEYSEVKVSKKGVGTKSGTGFLMHEWTYTPDYGIWWNERAHGLLHYPINSGFNLKETLLYSNEGVSFIECKPDYKFRAENKLFSHKQKVMYAIHGVYVNMASIPKFFGKSFVPEKWLYTTVKKELKAEYKRKLPRLIDEFLEVRLEWQRKKHG